jgi:Cdc6-like AAA superfamily ATPase
MKERKLTQSDARHVVFPTRQTQEKYRIIASRLDEVDRHLAIHKTGLRRNRAIIDAIRGRIDALGGVP